MSITAPKGFVAGAVAAGIKPGGGLDLALVDAAGPVTASAVFTTNTAAAPPVLLSRLHAAGGSVRAVVLNSGCANAATGEPGMAAAMGTAKAVAAKLGCDPDEVVVCSTGPIGDLLPLNLIEDGLSRLSLSSEGGPEAAAAILTTDRRPKQEVFSGDGFTVGGMAKGAGMVRPDMATMLAVVTTDAVADTVTLDEVFRSAVERSFNALDIDGCESTNDTAVLLASGASGVRPQPDVLAAAVETLCRCLTRQMATDAEGATRVVTIEIEGAADDRSALRMARAVADSALVRASFHGPDPNWGRLLAAIGSTRQPMLLEEVGVSYAGVDVAVAGRATEVDHASLAGRLSGDFTVRISVGAGPGWCSLLTTDLTPDYVRFNGERS